MTRLVYTLFLLVLPLATFAKADSVRFPAAIEISIGPSFIKTPADRFVLGSMQPNGNCYSGLLSVRVVGGFFLGMSGTHNKYWLNNAEVRKDIYNRYTKPGYYTTVDVPGKKRIDNMIAINSSYILHTHAIDFEPFVRAGVCFPFWGDSGRYAVLSKKMNDHYYSKTTAGFHNRGSQEIGGGIRLAIAPDASIVSLSVTAGYTYGRMVYRINETTDDYLGNKTHAESKSSSPFYAWYVRAGIMVRLPP